MPTPNDYTELQLTNPPNTSEDRTVATTQGREDQAMPTHPPTYPDAAFADVRIDSTPRFNRHNRGREEGEVPAAPEGLIAIPGDEENQGS